MKKIVREDKQTGIRGNRQVSEGEKGEIVGVKTEQT